MVGPTSLFREFAVIPHGQGRNSYPDYAQRPGRSCALVPGYRVFRGFEAPRQAGMDAELYRRTALADQEPEQARLPDPYEAVLRPLPEGRADAEVDEGRSSGGETALRVGILRKNRVDFVKCK